MLEKSEHLLADTTYMVCMGYQGNQNITFEGKGMSCVYKIIYVYPETVLKTLEPFKIYIAKKTRIALFLAIDEVHCVCKWGMVLTCVSLQEGDGPAESYGAVMVQPPACDVVAGSVASRDASTVLRTACDAREAARVLPTTCDTVAASAPSREAARVLPTTCDAVAACAPSREAARVLPTTCDAVAGSAPSREAATVLPTTCDVVAASAPSREAATMWGRGRVPGGRVMRG
jgi:hypothetical protein